MRLTIKKGTLLSGLYLAQGIADRKSTMPILANVLLRTEGRDKLVLAATDLNITLIAELGAQVEMEGGLTLAAKHLFDIVKSLPGDEVRIRRAENQYANIVAGKVEYSVVAMSDRDFPKLPVPREVKFVPVEVTTLRDMIRKTFFSISADETRYHLNGVLLETEPSGETVRARMVSTDGHRLSKVERDVPGAPILGPGIIIPRKGLGEMRRGLESLSGTVEIGIHQGHFFMRAADNVLTVKLIEAQFPPYQQVIPREQSRIAVVNRLALLEALRRISIMSSDKTHGVKLSVEPGILRVQSDNPDLGQGREEIDIRYDGTVLSIGFNARYFIELLSEIESEEVKLEFGGELDPALVRPVDDDYLGVVMPMRI